MTGSAQPDASLSIPLVGTCSIEASAGTGKTFTLATLYLRFLIERQLLLPHILVVTFTNAATQELRQRIRERLLIADKLLSAPENVTQGMALRPEVCLTRQLLQQHLAQSKESKESLRYRVLQAVKSMDFASIFTIHGFCARILTDFAWETNHQQYPVQLIENHRGLYQQLAADLWRHFTDDPRFADIMNSRWHGDISLLATDLPQLILADQLTPAAPAWPTDPRPRLHEVARQLADAFQKDGSTCYQLISRASDEGALNKSQYAIAKLNQLWRILTTWSQSQHFDTILPKTIRLLTADELKKRTNKNQSTPQIPLSDVVQAYLSCVADLDQSTMQRELILMHALRKLGQHKMRTLKDRLRVHTYDDLIANVADVVCGHEGLHLRQSIRKQYCVALIDEFQDTDAQQWKIFQAIFASADQSDQTHSALFLIGDPKQAIYGFRGGHLHTYLAATRTAALAPPLTINYRSRPCVLNAIDALYQQAGSHAFATNDIQFSSVKPAGNVSDDSLKRDQNVAPALTIWQASAPQSDQHQSSSSWTKDSARRICTNACVSAIHDWLDDSRNARTSLNGRAIVAKDLAILVRTHYEAQLIHTALTQRGIPAITSLRQSVFADEHAYDILFLLQALHHTLDHRYLRLFCLTPLGGLDARTVANFSSDLRLPSHWQSQCEVWRQLYRQNGPLALISELCAHQAERLVRQQVGEQILTLYLQLGEMLQQAIATHHTLPRLIRWLEHQLTHADDDEEKQRQYLPIDENCVQILTLHKSKGLEFPLVFLPYSCLAHHAKTPNYLCPIRSEDGQKHLIWKKTSTDPSWLAALASWEAEQRAEEARLLYVGLTRAQYALWVASGPFHSERSTPPTLSTMLDNACVWQPSLANTVCLDHSPIRLLPPLLQPEQAKTPVPEPRVHHSQLFYPRLISSFSQLSHWQSPLPTDVINPVLKSLEESQSTAATQDMRFSGSRFGTVFHEALQFTTFSSWRNWPLTRISPDEESTHLENALRRGGYQTHDFSDGLSILNQLIGLTLAVPLSNNFHLARLSPGHYQREMEFQFSMNHTQTSHFLSRLHHYGVATSKQSLGKNLYLDGMMTGIIDLIYIQNNQWFIVDYKTNILPDYSPTSLQAAVQEHAYDLQAIIYTIAIHRWLRFRLHDRYQYSRDFGGIYYLFCRGLNLENPQSGVYSIRFSQNCIETIDALFQ